jgi:hypothetical protein
MERRELLYASPKRPPDFAALGERYLAAGRQTDALEAFDRVKDEATRLALIGKVTPKGIKAGNFFILNRINGVTPLSDAEWADAYRNAREAGKDHYALKIAQQLGDADKIRESQEALGIAPEIEPEGTEIVPEDEASEGGEAEAETPAE